MLRARTSPETPWSTLSSPRASTVRRAPPVIAGLPDGALEGKKTILVTAHRRESFGDAFAAMCRALRRIADSSPEANIVYPVHLNPNVDGPVRALLGGHERIHLIKPVT